MNPIEEALEWADNFVSTTEQQGMLERAWTEFAILRQIEKEHQGTQGLGVNHE